MVNHPHRNIQPDETTLETVKQYVRRRIASSDLDITLDDAIETADGAPIVKFAIEERTVTKYLRDSGEWERTDHVRREGEHHHMNCVVAITDLGIYGLSPVDLVYTAPNEKRAANRVKKSLNAALKERAKSSN